MSEDVPDDSAAVAGGQWGETDRAEARQIVRLVMKGAGGRNAQARLAAAKLILGVKGDAAEDPKPVTPMTPEQIREALKGLN